MNEHPTLRALRIISLAVLFDAQYETSETLKSISFPTWPIERVK